MSSKIVFLGICAANRDLLIEWADEGLLPNYKTAMERGLTGFIDSMPGFYVGATWPSFATCVSPAEHSRHYISQIEPGSYRQIRNPKGEGIRRDDRTLPPNHVAVVVVVGGPDQEDRKSRGISLHVSGFSVQFWGSERNEPQQSGEEYA